MPRFEKFLPSKETAPVDRVARRALKLRLRAVAWFLERTEVGEPENVHQLRIWTRRSAAALDLFAPCLPDRRRRKMKKELRKLRRCAGRVRDCDVLLARLRADEDWRALPDVARAVKRERRGARRELKRLRAKLLKRDRFVHRSESLLAAIAWPKRHSSRATPPFGPWCRRQLAPLVADFLRQSEGHLDDSALHRFRLAVKRLRYALELAFAALPAAAHRVHYEELTDLQDRLGEVCDRMAAVRQLEDWIQAEKQTAPRRTLRQLLAEERVLLDKTRAKFLRWWTPTRSQRLKKRCRSLEVSPA
jgi:CHAD domain-containing protein